MPARIRWGALLAAAAATTLLATSPAAATGIDFGTPLAEDTLEGGSGSGMERGYAAPAPPRYRARTGGYVVHAPRSTYFRGTGIFANAQGSGGSVLYVHAPPRDHPARSPAIVDLRENAGPHRRGVSVEYVGSAKIIHIAPQQTASVPDRAGKDIAALPAPAPAEAVPVPSRSPRARNSEPVPGEDAAPATDPTAGPQGTNAPFLEPWTDEWLRDCVERYPDFDASLGTYRGEDGLRRFCTGERGSS